jgi:hypothetical protein
MLANILVPCGIDYFPGEALLIQAAAETILPVAFVNHRDLRDPNPAPPLKIIPRADTKSAGCWR